MVSSMHIDGSWRVTFPEGWGAPAEAHFSRLMSWTESGNHGIRYFSGTACYHKTISSVEEAYIGHSRIALSLGEVYDVAEVYLNGKSAGILWKPPYTLDITALMRAGENDLKIAVPRPHIIIVFRVGTPVADYVVTIALADIPSSREKYFFSVFRSGEHLPI